MAGARQRVPFYKINSFSSQVVGGNTSIWLSAGQPSGGVLPAATTVCNSTTRGALYFNPPTAPAYTYLTKLAVYSGLSVCAVELHDRLVHNWSAQYATTTTQAVSVNLVPLLNTDNLQARVGLADYSEVQWWLEISSATTAAANVTVSYTTGTGAAGSVVVPVTVSGAGRIISVSVPGVFIRSVDSVTLSAALATSGSLAVVATRQVAEVMCPVVGATFTADWVATGLPRVHDSSCLFLLVDNSTTQTGGFIGALTMVQG